MLFVDIVIIVVGIAVVAVIAVVIMTVVVVIGFSIFIPVQYFPLIRT